jgi:HlyD family secretion protein
MRFHNLLDGPKVAGSPQAGRAAKLGRAVAEHISPLTLPKALALAGIICVALVAYIVLAGQHAARLPAGLAKSNGRIEIERIDIASKYPGRIRQIDVREGDDVTRQQTIAQMDDTETRAQLAAAKAAVRRATQSIERAKAEVVLREAEHRLSEAELGRARELERKAVASAADLDRRIAQNDVAQAHILAAQAAVADAVAARDAAEAEVARIEATLADMTLTSPVEGRVEYRLAQVGTVLPAGGRIVTVLDLSQTYMTVFLPTTEAGRARLGAEARIILDAAPAYVVPATVAFVASEAQFTPKAVETSDERAKLMYRVKLRFDPKLIGTYRDHVKAGLTGDAYVKLDASAAWPKRLDVRLPDAR